MPTTTTSRHRDTPDPSRGSACHEVRVDELLGDDELRAEMSRLMAANQELLAARRTTAEPPGDAVELQRLRAENAELHACLDEMEHAWQERQREYESLLEEKSEVIRELHLKLQEGRKPAAAPAADAADMDEISRLKHELEEQRRQLAEDEESLMQQMREMELTMCRERAEMARQRNEIQRLQAEMNHEAEQASRDSGLRERLLSLQRRPAQGSADPTHGPVLDQPTPRPKGSSGVFRRIFGGNG